MLGNSSLAPELRRSAAEQLLGLAAATSRGDPRLLEAMTAPRAIELIASSAVSELTPKGRPLGRGDTMDGGNNGGMAPRLGGLLDVQFPLACVNLLYTLCCLSPKCHRWLLAKDGGRPFLGHLLPLLFHPLITARRATARLTAAAFHLGGEADKWSGWSQALATEVESRAQAVSSSSEGGGGGQHRGGSSSQNETTLLCLPDVFSSGYLFPCRVTWVRMTSQEGAPLKGPSSANTLQEQPSLQGLVEEQRFLVHILVEERRLLRKQQAILSAIGNAKASDDASVLASLLLNDAPDGGGSGQGLSPVAAQACLANIRALDLPARAAAVASALSTASSHAEASAALLAASALAATCQGAAVLSRCQAWGPAYEPLLRTAPATEEDRELWVLLLQVVQRVLVSASSEAAAATVSTTTVRGDVHQPVGPSHFESQTMAQLCIHLSLCLAQSVPTLLSAPLAARAPKNLPLALAGSALAMRTSDGGASALGQPLSSRAALAQPGDDGGSSEEPLGRRGQRLTVHLTMTAMQTLSALVR